MSGPIAHGYQSRRGPDLCLTPSTTPSPRHYWLGRVLLPPRSTPLSDPLASCVHRLLSTTYRNEIFHRRIEYRPPPSPAPGDWIGFTWVVSVAVEGAGSESTPHWWSLLSDGSEHLTKNCIVTLTGSARRQNFNFGSYRLHSST